VIEGIQTVGEATGVIGPMLPQLQGIDFVPQLVNRLTIRGPRSSQAMAFSLERRSYLGGHHGVPFLLGFLVCAAIRSASMAIVSSSAANRRARAGDLIPQTGSSVCELILSNVVQASCDATAPSGLREQLFEFFGG